MDSVPISTFSSFFVSVGTVRVLGVLLLALALIISYLLAEGLNVAVLDLLDFRVFGVT